MRYLRRYDEAKLTDTLTTEMVAELRTFCRNYLIDLIDLGYHIKVTPSFLETHCIITLNKPIMSIIGNYPINCEFIWNDIKESFITYIHMLENDYIINEIKFINFSNDFKIVDIKDLEGLDYYDKMFNVFINVSFKL
jgi:hypothetical protein